MGTTARGPQKYPTECAVWEKDKREEEKKGRGEKFKGSECQVLMCLFSITAVPGNDRERKQTAMLIYYMQTFNSTLKAAIIQSDCLIAKPYQTLTHPIQENKNSL